MYLLMPILVTMTPMLDAAFDLPGLDLCFSDSGSSNGFAALSSGALFSFSVS